MKVVKRRQYDSEFRRQAVKLCQEDCKIVSEVAEDLGRNEDLLYHWRKQM